MELSIIIPAYNEAERIAPTLRAFHRHPENKKMNFEILVSDDGSTDSTVELVQSMQIEIPQLRVLVSPQNKGKGHAIKQGMLQARGKIRLFSDADGSTPVEEMEKLLEPLWQNKAEISIGSRYHADSEIVNAQPFLRRKWSRLANNVVQKILLPGIADPHCGFKAFTEKAAEEIFSRCTIDGWSFDLEVLALAKKLNFRVAEVPVKWANDERSKGRISQLPREVYNLWKIKKQVN
jgi:glycosyltransferase involved in cell wall biosynthesis